MWNDGVSTTKGRAMRCLICCGLAALTALTPLLARSAGDEIQVYTDDVRAKGERGLEVHSNYVSRGRTTQDYPGEQPPNRILHLTPEFSFGLGNHMDWGFYLPTSASNDSGSAFMDGAKLRLKYLMDTEATGSAFFYGANVEVSRSTLRASPSKWQGELRGIVGMRQGEWLVAFNPILGWPLTRSVNGSTVDFELATKVSREVGHGLAVGVEHYSELGPVGRTVFGPGSGQNTYAVLDWEGKGWDLNVGIGHGWTGASDRRVFKLILGLPL